MMVKTLYCSGVSAFGAVADIGLSCRTPTDFVLSLWIGFGTGFLSIELRLRLLLR